MKVLCVYLYVTNFHFGKTSNVEDNHAYLVEVKKVTNNMTWC